MEIVIIMAAAIGLIGWWIWREGKHEEAGHPLENVTKNKTEWKEPEPNSNIPVTESIVNDVVVEVQAAKTVENSTKETKKKPAQKTKAKATPATTKTKKPAQKAKTKSKKA